MLVSHPVDRYIDLVKVEITSQECLFWTLLKELLLSGCHEGFLYFPSLKIIQFKSLFWNLALVQMTRAGGIDSITICNLSSFRFLTVKVTGR